MTRSIMLAFLLVLLFAGSFAQVTFPRNDVKDLRAGAYAFTNATIFTNSSSRIDGGVLLIRDGKIERAGKDLAVPAGYTVIDLKGRFIYPSFIDLCTSYGLPKVDLPTGGGGFGGPEQIQTKTKGAYNANQSIKADYNACLEFTADSKTAEKMRSAGIGTVLTFRADGLARGTSAIVTLGDDRDNVVMLKDKAAAHYALNRGTSRQSYPVSQMGFVSLLRQTYLDADWYNRQNPKPFKDLALEAWTASQNLPQIFEANGWVGDLRADKIGDEFGKQYIIRGGGDEYQRLTEIKATNAQLIIPVNFPEAYDVDDPLDAERVSLAEMKHWEMAPANAGMLEKAGIDFTITSDRLKDKADLLKSVRKAIEYGLSETMALKALTETPARLVNIQNKVGALNSGMEANFIITSGNLFSEETTIHENWVQGKRYVIKEPEVADLSGKYNLNINGQSYSMEVSGKLGSLKVKVKLTDSLSVDAKSKLDKDLISLSLNISKSKTEEMVRLSGWRQGNGWKGNGQLANGNWIEWKADYTGPLDKKEDKAKSKEKPQIGEVIYPFMAFGSKEKIKAEEILIKNATVWTNEKDGVLQNTDVLIKDGKISAIGKNLPTTGKTFDGTGKHLTPGIVDEHSHIGGGGNDVATNSAMVRIEDQLDSKDADIYRALAGGVVAVQVLHGSANPIGGQSAIIKLKWGASSEELKIKGADKYIKFALGENVKRTSNTASVRYPLTRMGVEQVYVDAFTNALTYEKKWKDYNALPEKVKTATAPPRKDLVDETMLEIIRGKRFVTCHSYVQSEINMMMKVAERFGFRINTFTHILEGYKVADKMKTHGVAASTFSDWWNYKWEVHYAIPYNAAIMHREGVLTAINSDDANMGRRLNQEAAKTIKYGDMTEEDALKMVTLNSAKMLHLDNQMGSIKVGKSGDVVLWTGHPLSVYSKAEKTIIEGGVYFDLERDQQLRKELETERARLVSKMIESKKSGAPTQKAQARQHLEFHCEGYDVDGFAEN